MKARHNTFRVFPVSANQATVLILFAFAGISAASALDFNSIEIKNGDVRGAAVSFVETLSDEEALSQTLMFGWQGASPTERLMEWIEKRGIGGIKIFGWNTPLPDNPTETDRRAATEALVQTIGVYQKLALGRQSKIPLFVATDQEGGIVGHIKGQTSYTPGNMAAGASGRPRDAYLEGYYIALELAALGVNMNFAPTVDVLSNKNSTLIGTRAFGDDPVNVGLLGAAYARGVQDAGLIATAKHFPGHGDTAADSHGTLPMINAALETLKTRELVPYQILIKEGIGAIMTGHIAFPQTSAGRMPASLSSYFVRDILRGELKFDGLVVTDDITMNGSTQAAGSQHSAALMALKAGSDIIMSSGNPPLDGLLWTNLLSEMQKDAAFNKRVREAASRVIKAKLGVFRGKNAPPIVPSAESAAKGITPASARDFYRDLNVRSATIVYEKSGAFPLKAQNTADVLLAGADSSFFTIGKKAYPNAKSIWVHPDFAADLFSMSRAASAIIFLLKSREDLPLLNSIKNTGKKIIIVSADNPVLLDGLDWADGALALYSKYMPQETYAAAFSLLSGKIRAEGKLPLNLSGAR